jgi:nucleoside-diphosphate-sugar epimerase
VVTVAITGGTGFIGSALIQHLSNEGFLIRALYRPSSVSGRLPAVTSVQWVPGDLEDLDSLRCLVQGAEAVVHCAGAVRGVNAEQFACVNADGVARMVQAAKENMVSRFLLISSLAAREYSLSPYAASKKKGEEILAGQAGNMAWDILRPPAVYGPGDRELLPLFRLMRRGVIPIVGTREGRFSLLYVDDLVEAICQWLRTESSGKGFRFELHDGHPGGYSWEQIAAINSQFHGLVTRCFSVPRRLLELAAFMNVFLARLGRYRPMLTPGKVRELFHPDWVCDNTPLTRETGWHPKVLFEEGLRRQLSSVG